MGISHSVSEENQFFSSHLSINNKNICQATTIRSRAITIFFLATAMLLEKNIFDEKFIYLEASELYVIVEFQKCQFFGNLLGLYFYLLYDM